MESLGIGVVVSGHEGWGWHHALHGRVSDELPGRIEGHVGVDVDGIELSGRIEGEVGIEVDGIEGFLWLWLALVQVVVVMETLAGV